MNAELFIARKITGTEEAGKSVSRPIVRIAIIGIALGLAVMILSVAIVTGFKNKVKDKVVGFGAHIQITNFDSNNSFETKPINKNQVSTGMLKRVKGIRHVQIFATKSGILKTRDNFLAIALKGIDENFDWTFFEHSMVAGEPFNITDSVKSKGIVISEYMSQVLKLNVGDKITVYFMQDPPRMRPFVVSGIYKTSIENFDKAYVVVDIRHLQRLNDWRPEQVSGYEILIDDFDRIESLTDSVYNIAGYHFADDGSTLKIMNIKERYPQIFDWLNIQDVNVWIILILMLIVAGMNMVSGLLILILERTNMIGLLKGLGYSNWRVQKIFLYQSGFLIGKGLLWGNIIGVAICLLQYYFAIIPLDETVYYVSAVPIDLRLWHVLTLNAGTLLTILLVMVLPSLIITKISPAKAIKFN